MTRVRDMNRAITRRGFIGGGAAVAGASLLGAAGCRPRYRRGIGRVLVLGMDGMDPTLAVRFMAEGRMPNFAALRDTGTFLPLVTSDPPQSPVAWSNFISGTNPGGHGVFDFVARKAATLRPHFSMTDFEANDPPAVRIGDYEIPLAPRRVENLRRGPVFWNDLEAAGVPCTILRIPSNFPPSPSTARTLSGLGTPDLQGTYGMFAYFTDAPGETDREGPGGRIRRVRRDGNTYHCRLPGPPNSMRGGQSVDLDFAVHVDRANGTALVQLGTHTALLRTGEWSEWLPLRFPLLGPLADARGMCRLHLRGIFPVFGLYVSPINLVPSEPALPISTPDNYARGLSDALGPFYTQGIAEDTAALSAGVLNEGEYREQAMAVLADEIRLYRHELNRFRDGLLFAYFSTLDLNSHMFWRTLDPKHPAHDPSVAEKHGDFLPGLYARMDQLLGEARATLAPNDLLLVVSDHGFGSFRRQFSLNTWLRANGFAVLHGGREQELGDYYASTDWTRTRAYGLGINGLYLNRRNREPDGIVRDGADYDDTCAALIRGLEAATDPATGERMITRVVRARDIYSGPHVAEAPDLLVCYAPNYRASWDTVLGRYPREIVADNTDKWSGDHTMDSRFMPGVFFAGRAVKGRAPSLTDMAPTLLAAFGLPRAAGMTGSSIL